MLGPTKMKLERDKRWKESNSENEEYDDDSKIHIYQLIKAH